MTKLALTIPPALLTGLFAGLMWLISRFESALGLPGNQVWALLVAVVGLTFIAGGLYSFYQHQTTVDPRYPNAASALVTTGIYQVTRNPMYVGFLCLLIGWGIFLSSIIALALNILFVLYMNRFQIKPEESALTSLFKGAYSDYCARVRRWL